MEGDGCQRDALKDRLTVIRQISILRRKCKLCSIVFKKDSQDSNRK